MRGVITGVQYPLRLGLTLAVVWVRRKQKRSLSYLREGNADTQVAGSFIT